MDRLEEAEKRRCGWCSRSIGVNHLTGDLRYHIWPASEVPPVTWVVAGDRCPGTGSPGRDV